MSGRALFSLMKKYLRVTSLLDEIEQLESISSSDDTHSGQALKLQFELTCATSQLIIDLSEAMGWNKTDTSDEEQVASKQPIILGSIFAPSVVADMNMKVSQKYKKRRDFTSREAYGEYVKATLEPAMRAVLLEDYESLSAGDVGEFKRSNDGTPPAQFRWETYGSTYWVQWELVEIIDPHNETKGHEGDEPGW